MEIEDDEILQGFIEESLEHLADIENDLLTIEEAGADIDEDLVNKVFRAAHSIKGGAGFMGLTAIQGLSHSTENVLGMIRSKKLVPTPEIVNVLLMASDQLQSMIEDVNNSNEVDISSHVDSLDAIADGTFVSPQAESEQIQEEESEPVPVEEVLQEVIESTISPETEVMSGPEPLIEPEPVVEIASPASIPTPVQPSAPATSPATPKVTAPAKTETSLRVHVSLLDSLMNLAGELVLSRNQLLQTIGSDDLRNAEAVGQRIDLITSELQ